MELSTRLAVLVDAVRSSPHNLVSRADRDRLDERHVAESVAFVQRLPERAPIADVGSGGGFPGLVVAAHRPATPITLIEATRKKAEFLRATADAMGLPRVTVRWGRVEELAQGELRGRFALVTARAVAPLSRLVPWCAPLLEPGGELHLIKGERWAEELHDATDAMRRLALEPIAVPAPFSPAPDATIDPRPPVVVTIAARSSPPRPEHP